MIFAGDRGVENIGWFFTVNASTLFLARPLFGKLQDKYGFFKMIIPALLLFILSLLIISFSYSLIMFLVSAVLFGFGYGSAQPMINALCMKSVPSDKRGVASSTRFMGSDLGNIAGPIIASFLITIKGYELMWRYMTVSIFIAIIAVLIFRKKINNIESLSKIKI
jgi:MFS family permease